MSQHHLTPKNPTAISYVMVGWDRPLNGFFGQVLANEPGDDGEDNYLVNIGCWEGITDPQVVLDAVAEYAEIPDELLDTLRGEALMSPYATMEEHNRVASW